MRHLAFLTLAACGVALCPPIMAAKPVAARPTTPAMGKLSILTKTTPAKSWSAIPPMARARVLKSVDAFRARMHPSTRHHMTRKNAPVKDFSVHLARYPIGPNGTPRLIHVWAERNLSNHGENMQYHVDVFRAGARAGAWNLMSTGTFEGRVWPEKIEVRRLHPKAGKGAVIALETSHFKYYEVNLETVTFGTEASRHGVAQRFKGGWVGHDGDTALHRFSTDARGYTSVVATHRKKDEAGTLSSKQRIFTWNGRGYVEHTTSR